MTADTEALDPAITAALDASVAATSTALERLPDLTPVAVAFGLPEGSLHPNGLRLDNADTPWDEWVSYGHTIGAFGRWSRFALGDWILFGEALYGEEAHQATEAVPADRYDVARRVTGLKPATLQNYASICGRVPLVVRRTELDFSVHAPVAPLERADQIYWLEQAVANGWAREELAAAIKAWNDPTPATEEPEVEVLDPPLSRAERLENAARLVYSQAQRSGGGFHVPAEAMAQLSEALGEE